MDEAANEPSVPEKEKNRETVLKIFITEIICVAVILIGITVTKFFFKTQYKKIANFYNSYFLTETTVEEVLHGEDTNEV